MNPRTPDSPASQARPPAVSVVMTAYNAEAWLAEALESVLAQTLADFELLFVDDGSTDATHAIAEGYARQDARIRVLRLARNGGVANAKNAALGLARAPLVAICDADDRQLPERLAHQMAAFEEDPRRVVVGCRVRPFGDAANHPEVWLPFEPRLARARILFQVLCGDAANMFRRELATRHGLRYPTGDVWEDWVFQARALRHGEVAVLPETLLLYRRHAAQETSADRQAASRRRTRATLRAVLDEAGIAASAAELDLHHAIAPSPFGRPTDPDYLARHRDELAARAKAWLGRLAEAAARSGWTSREAVERVGEAVLQALQAP